MVRICTSVDRIPKKRMLFIGQVYPNLMGSPGFQVQFQQSITSETFPYLKMRYRRRPLSTTAMRFLSTGWRPIGAFMVPVSSRIFPMTSAT